MVLFPFSERKDGQFRTDLKASGPVPCPRVTSTTTVSRRCQNRSAC